jgi:hypothetical protein
MKEAEEVDMKKLRLKEGYTLTMWSQVTGPEAGQELVLRS